MGFVDKLKDTAHKLASSDTATHARERAQGYLDHYAGKYQSAGEGAGQWGAHQPTSADLANHQLWRRVADGARVIGMPNAARHMSHYLDNTGEPLNVNVDEILLDVPSLRDFVPKQLLALQEDALTVLASVKPTTAYSYSLLTQSQPIDLVESRDWFYAIGGCQMWMDCTVAYHPVPGSPGGRVTVSARMRIKDEYNWDQDKVVPLAGLTVKDDVLGRLHAVGSAKEYPISGQSRLFSQQFDWTPGMDPTQLQRHAALPQREKAGGLRGRLGALGNALGNKLGYDPDPQKTID